MYTDLGYRAHGYLGIEASGLMSGMLLMRTFLHRLQGAEFSEFPRVYTSTGEYALHDARIRNLSYDPQIRGMGSPDTMGLAF